MTYTYCMEVHMKKIIAVILILITLASSSFIYYYRKYSPPQELEVHFIDVGQGDSILVRTIDGKNMLIDSGSSEKSATVLDYLKKEGVRKLDIVIATHPDEDHIGSMSEIIKKHEIGTFYLPNKLHNTMAFESMITLLGKERIQVAEALSGDTIPFSEGTEILVLSPEKKNYPNNNAFSIACKLTYGETSFLFTGDIEAINEYAMMNKFGDQLQANVLKLSHHGSDSANCPDFLEIVNPIAAVASCGYNNKYNHPNPSVLKVLKDKGIPLYRTDLQGSIVFFSNGETISVNQAAPYEIK